MEIKVKYVVAEVFGCEIAVMFPELLDHAHFTNTFQKIVSAGFVRIDMDEKCICCHGRSNSLGIDSRGNEDAFLIAQLLWRDTMPVVRVETTCGVCFK